MRALLFPLLLLAGAPVAQAQSAPASADLGSFRLLFWISDGGNVGASPDFTVLAQEAGRTDIRLDGMLAAVQSQSIHWRSSGSISAWLALDPLAPYHLDSVVLHGWYDGELQVGALPAGSTGELGYAHNHAQVTMRDDLASGAWSQDHSVQRDDIDQPWAFALGLDNPNGGAMRLDLDALAWTDASSSYAYGDARAEHSYAQLGLGEAVLTVFTSAVAVPEPPLWLMLAGGLPLVLLRRGAAGRLTAAPER